MSGARENQFEKISDLTSHINFKFQHSILPNLEKKDKETKKNNDTVREKYNFNKKPSMDDKFEQQIATDILKCTL